VYLVVGKYTLQCEDSRMDGNKLVAARKRLCWTQERAAEEFQVGLTTIHRWERGEVTPRGDSLLLIREKYGLTPVDLGITEEAETRLTLVSPAREHLQPLAAFATEDLFTCLWSLAFRPYRGYQPLQEAMSLLLKDDETMHTNQPNHHIKRREALQRLVRFPLLPALLTMQPSASVLEQPMNKETLAQYALGIAACRELTKSADHDDLITAFHSLSAYVPGLQAIVHDSATHRQEAAGLTAQALFWQAILTGHLKNSYQAIPLLNEATTYAQESGDLSLLVGILLEKVWTCYYGNQHQEGLRTIQQAIALIREHHDTIPSLVQGAVHTMFAIMQAKQGLDPAQSIHTAQEMLVKFTDTSEVPIYLDFSPPQNTFHTAIATYYKREYTSATNLFNQLVDLEHPSLINKQPLPERVAIEVLNNATFAELKNPQRDQEKALHLWIAAAQRSRELQSERRFSEVLAAYEFMELLWPNDKRIQELRDLTQHW
jgi:transcriptional regulator with XRE-family HTH domain